MKRRAKAIETLLERIQSVHTPARGLEVRETLRMTF